MRLALGVIAIGVSLLLASAAGAAVRDRYCSPTGDYCTSAQRSGGAIKLRLATFSFSGRYRLCVKPKYARAPATRTPSQLTQNGMLKPPISTCHPKMIRSRCIIATTRNSVAVTVI